MQMCEFKRGEECDKLKDQRTNDDNRDEEKTLRERDDNERQREWNLFREKRENDGLNVLTERKVVRRCRRRRRQETEAWVVRGVAILQRVSSQ